MLGFNNKNEQLDNQIYKIIFNEATDGILAADVNTKKFILANKRIAEITGYSEEELLNLTVSNIHPKKDLPIVIQNFEKQVKGEITIAKDTPILRKDTSIIFCDINSKPINIGEKTFLLGFFRQSCERLKIELQLRERIDELEIYKRLNIGREAKMHELKEKIKELEVLLNNKSSG